MTTRYGDPAQAHLAMHGGPRASGAPRRLVPPPRRWTIDTRASLRAATEVAGSAYLELPGWVGLVDHLADVEVVALAPSLARAAAHLMPALEDRGVTVVIPDGEDPAAQVADVPVGITWAEMAIAETGSLLVAEHELGDRVVTMLCRRLIQLVDVVTIEPRLEAAAAYLRAHAGKPGFASLMTGPSRTADIERSLTIGVQGPDEVDVVVLLDTRAEVEQDGDPTSEVPA